MLLFPNYKEYKKYHRQRNKLNKLECNSSFPNIGYSGLQVLRSKRITAVQIEAVRKLISKIIRRKYRTNLKLNLYPDLPITKKASGVRMGKGYGRIDHWSVAIRGNRVVFEIDNRITKEVLFDAFNKAGIKLPSIFKVYINRI